MARKRIEKIPVLKSWADVDAALCEIAENEIALDEIQSELERQTIGAEKIANQAREPHTDRIAKLERDIEAFVDDHRDDLGKNRSMALNFGTVNYRYSTNIVFPKPKERYEQLLQNLKDRQMDDCISVVEKALKEPLRKYGREVVNEVGATWKQKDTFGYETNKEKLERLRSGIR